MKTDPQAITPPTKPPLYKVRGRVSEVCRAQLAKTAAMFKNMQTRGREAASAAIAASSDAGPAKTTTSINKPEPGNVRSAIATAADGGRCQPEKPATPPRSSLGATRAQELELAYSLEADPEKRSEIFTLIKAARSTEEESTDTLAVAYAQERDPSKKANIFARIKNARTAEKKRQ